MTTVLAATLLWPALVNAAPDQNALYVSPSGDDAAAGTAAAPFATIGRARAELARLRASGQRQPRTVYLRGGVHRITKTLEFTPADSGTTEAPVTYAAYPGERPVLSGGRRLTGWRSAGHGVWQTTIPEVTAGQWYFNQLFVNGGRRTRARIPNVGYLYTADILAPIDRGKWWSPDILAKQGFIYRDRDLTTWHNMSDATVVLYHSWTTSIHTITSLDPATHTVRLAPYSTWPIGYWWEYNTRYHVENVREALDAPGEWYLDRSDGTLSYLPLPGEDMSTAEVIAPVVPQTLLSFRGDPSRQQFVEHLAFRGISFQHADFAVSAKMPTDQQGAVERPATIHGLGLRHTVFEDCELAHVGENGIWLAEGSTDNELRRCHVHDVGGGALYIGPHAYKDAPDLLVRRNTVENCWLHHGSQVFRGSSGIWVGPSSGNRVLHNEISDFGHIGISCGWSWGYAPSSANHNEIGWNHVHHISNGLFSDGGGIYCLGVSPGTVLHHNLVHDVIPTPLMTGGTGIYLDEGSTGIRVEHNVVYNVGAGGFHQHYGRENVIRNNIIAFAGREPVTCARAEEHLSYTFEHNIVLCDQGQATSAHWSPLRAKTAFNHNLYWDTSGKEPLFSGVSFAKWRESGRDQDSLVADPKFADAANRDFRLAPDSPALRLGFAPCDLAAVGLTGSPDWVGAPQALRREPLPKLPPPPPPPPPRPFRDGFESGEVGKPPAGWTCLPADQPAAIRVDSIAGGGQCLRLTEIPGLPFVWQPHVFYSSRPHTSGRVRVACDLLNSAERPCVCAVMLRDYSQAGFDYREGPSLSVAEDGTLSAAGKPLAKLPLGQWVHLEMVLDLGPSAAKRFKLVVTAPGQPAQTFADLPYLHPEFAQLAWFGLASMGQPGTTWCVDSVVLEAIP